jgi:hypothetical protein
MPRLGFTAVLAGAALIAIALILPDLYVPSLGDLSWWQMAQAHPLCGEYDCLLSPLAIGYASAALQVWVPVAGLIALLGFAQLPRPELGDMGSLLTGMVVILAVSIGVIASCPLTAGMAVLPSSWSAVVLDVGVAFALAGGVLALREPKL